MDVFNKQFMEELTKSLSKSDDVVHQFFSRVRYLVNPGGKFLITDYSPMDQPSLQIQKDLEQMRWKFIPHQNSSVLQYFELEAI